MLAELAKTLQFLDLISIGEWTRMLFLFVHLMVAAVTLCMVFLTDLRIMTGQFTIGGIQKAAHSTALLLVALWITGLIIIYMDTGFNLTVLAGKSKLLFKLICVLVLTVNGFVLHGFSLAVVTGSRNLSRMYVLLLAVTGSISTSHWLLAAFVGASKPLGRLPFNVLLQGYAVVLAIALLGGIVFAPILRRQLIEWRKRNAKGEESTPNDQRKSNSTQAARCGRSVDSSAPSRAW